MIEEFIHETFGPGSKPLLPVLHAIGQMAYEAHDTRMQNVKLREELAAAQTLIDDFRMKQHMNPGLGSQKLMPRTEERRGTKMPHGGKPPLRMRGRW